MAKAVIGFFFLFAALGALPPAGLHAEEAKLDIRLMTDSETRQAARCGLRLWQKGRSPGSNRFAYAFAVPVVADSALTGLVKVGTKVRRLDRIAVGGEVTGVIHQFQVYRHHGTEFTVMVEMFDFYEVGDGVEVEDARVTFYDRDVPPFPVRVSGAYFCSTSAKTASVPDAQIGTTLSKVLDLRSFDDVPRQVLEQVRAVAECDHDSLSVVWGALYETGTGQQVWEVPCFLGAYQGAMVFVQASADTPDDARRIVFQSPPGVEEGQTWLMEPRVNTDTGVITSVELGRTAADCGKYQRHRFSGAEDPLFELIEFREKPECDETFIPIEEFPLVYSKQPESDQDPE